MESWERKFRDRMVRFEQKNPSKVGWVAFSIKLRVNSGCFHRSCCHHAYDLIDEHLASVAPSDVCLTFEEHESGPEILVYLAVTTAGLTVAKSVIDLVATIIKARSEGARKGDRHSAPVEIIIRRVARKDELREERILSFHSTDEVDPAKLGQLLAVAAKKIVDDGEEGS